MSIELLENQLPVPSNPLESDDAIKWQTFQNSIGLELPQDYKDFIQRYGTGCIDSFVWIFNPFSRNEHLNLKDQMTEILDTLRMLKYDQPAFPLFPERGGLLPCGATDNGDTIFWITSGEPAHWRIAVHESRGPQWENYAFSLTDFLAKILSKDIICPIFPEDFPSDSPTFAARIA